MTGNEGRTVFWVVVAVVIFGLWATLVYDADYNAEECDRAARTQAEFDACVHILDNQ